MSNEDRITQGSCRCGQVQLKVRGRPVMTFACHCTGCQKMTASAFSLSSLYPEDAFEWSGLEPVIGGLHGDLRHFFCPHCLSWMFTRFDAMGPFVNVRSTMLDEAHAFTTSIETCTSENLRSSSRVRTSRRRAAISGEASSSRQPYRPLKMGTLMG